MPGAAVIGYPHTFALALALTFAFTFPVAVPLALALDQPAREHFRRGQ